MDGTNHVHYGHVETHEPGPEQEGEQTVPNLLGHLERAMPRNVPTFRKLKLLARVHFPNGIVRDLDALVDTGAEINIINPKFVPRDIFQPAKRPLKVGMANAVCLKGGKREASFTIALKGLDVDSRQGVEIRIPTVAYDGEMVCDLILSYAWLAQQNALVNPRRHGVLFQEENRLVWIPGLNIVSRWDIQHGEGSSIIASPVEVNEDTNPQEKNSDQEEGQVGTDPDPPPMGGVRKMIHHPRNHVKMKERKTPP